ncbi:hypothetical protein GJ744_002682 [Endocarpon pusillum]|uniref:RING-14 protein n=1 Tax=Endocarpon pusillum TaxID=364733 RepID=A0A8H7A8J2_9EURO|nr:hypothetical protein GJ744_002682 [Endocarpon pusillum]
MKFAHDFDASLRKEEYPPEWLDSAISYRQLKKCIKKVQKELQELGLDPHILEQLWQNVNNNDRNITTRASPEEPRSRPYHYSVSSGVATLKPRLTVAIDPRDGLPLDAWLSPETRNFLKGLPRSPRTEKQLSFSAAAGIDGGTTQPMPLSVSEHGNPVELQIVDPTEAFETVEIPLTSDSEFFQILKRELDDLNRLQETKQKQLTVQINKLGSDITKLTEMASSRSRAEVEAWREIFRLYVDSQIFFSTSEQDAGTRPCSTAQKQLEDFSNGIADKRKRLRLSHNGSTALKTFLYINASLLHFMKFQEINRTALTKIMKKFDKQTALHMQANLPPALANEHFVAHDLAKAACFTIQEQLLPIVPQINDYLCPVCLTISFKPVRLRCNHVFCIRCLIVMQRAKQDHCPLCRGGFVMEACSENLDAKLMKFLKRKFPAEVKAKQKENQHAAGVDRYGEGYDKCAVM